MVEDVNAKQEPETTSKQRAFQKSEAMREQRYVLMRQSRGEAPDLCEKCGKGGREYARQKCSACLKKNAEKSQHWYNEHVRK